jgi:hypothetical protein
VGGQAVWRAGGQHGGSGTGGRDLSSAVMRDLSIRAHLLLDKK